MPLFDFQCTICPDFKLDVYLPLLSSEKPSCDCGGEMERVYSVTFGKGADTFPFVTRNITKDGSPVEVTSPGHLRELCRMNGVRQRDDAAWANERWEGYDFRTKSQKYSGNGSGLPGCWV